jgi:hypothetical protein
MTDPFCSGSLEANYHQPSSPLAMHEQSRPAKKLKLRATFTEEMDYHLWRTYMTYLQDPTVTPFKALPSTMPPNGVCHRVARMARKTWKGPRVTRHVAARGAAQLGRCGTPDTIRPAKSGSNTPIAGPSRTFLRYPTEKQCRKRLRDLAKQKPTLSAHYQRLLRRSPSLLQSSPPPEPETAPEPQQVPESQPMLEPPQMLEPPKAMESNLLSSPFPQGSSAFSFSTRDMNVSLATSTAASMQMGNPLSQLANNITPRPPQSSWTKTRSSAHQKSQSLHIGLGLGLENVLGSPFKPKAEVTQASAKHHNAQTWHPSSSAQQPRLGSPFQLHFRCSCRVESSSRTESWVQSGRHDGRRSTAASSLEWGAKVQPVRRCSTRATEPCSDLARHDGRNTRAKYCSTGLTFWQSAQQHIPKSVDLA